MIPKGLLAENLAYLSMVCEETGQVENKAKGLKAAYSR